MKEAIGGSYIFEIVIVFIALFSAFLVYSISYTKAFRVKNEILSLIEENQGYTTSARSSELFVLNDKELEADPSVEAKAFYLIKKYGYKHDILDERDDLCYMVSNAVGGSSGENVEGVMRPGGYCLYKLCNPGDGQTMNTTYKVTAFIALEIPVISVVVKIPISGETRTIYSDNGKMDCSNGREID